MGHRSIMRKYNKMKQNNWHRMMGISNAFSLSVPTQRTPIAPHLCWPFISILFCFHVAQREKKSFIFFFHSKWKGYELQKFQWFMRTEKNFTGKSDWQGFAVNVHKVATRSEEHNMFLGQIRLTHTAKKIAAFMNQTKRPWNMYSKWWRKKNNNLRGETLFTVIPCIFFYKKMFIENILNH